MRFTKVLFLAPVLPACGCNLTELTVHNLTNEPVTLMDEKKLDHRLMAEAKAMWCEVCQQFPARTFTPEFADGFTDGYADYLDIGGKPGPPAVPPLRYRRSSYLTPHGHALIRDYMIGFQYGAEVASATGKRQFLTVPVLLTEVPPQPPLDVKRIPSLPIPPAGSLDAPGSVPPRPAPAAPLDPNAPVPVPLGGVPGAADALPPTPGMAVPPPPSVPVPVVPSVPVPGAASPPPGLSQGPDESTGEPLVPVMADVEELPRMPPPELPLAEPPPPRLPIAEPPPPRPPVGGMPR